jgi:hypothetical protein
MPPLALVAPARMVPASGATVLAASTMTRTAEQADPAAQAIIAQQHVTLAKAETELSWQETVSSLNAVLNSRLSAAAFDDTWIDPNDGRVKIGVVGLNPRLKAIVMQAVRATGPFAAADLVPVQYSLARLVSADAWIATRLDKPSLRAGGINFDVGYRPDLNRVQLEVADYQLTAAERALVTLRRRSTETWSKWSRRLTGAMRRASASWPSSTLVWMIRPGRPHTASATCIVSGEPPRLSSSGTSAVRAAWMARTAGASMS